MSVEKVQIGPATLYLGDNAEVRDLVSRSAAVVSDPPYGMKWQIDSTRFTADKNGQRKRGDGRNDWAKIIGDDAPFDPVPWLVFKQVILWGYQFFADKVPLGTARVWIKKHEHMYNTFLADAELAWQKGGHGVYVFKRPDCPSLRAKEGGIDDRPTHPTQKPISLMVWCIEATKSKTIFDPYMGSGTTGVAALKCGREFIGVEIQPQYFDTACKRIEAAYRQPDMFVEQAPAAAAPEQEPLL